MFYTRQGKLTRPQARENSTPLISVRIVCPGKKKPTHPLSRGNLPPPFLLHGLVVPCKENLHNLEPEQIFTSFDFSKKLMSLMVLLIWAIRVAAIWFSLKPLIIFHFLQAREAILGPDKNVRESKYNTSKEIRFCPLQTPRLFELLSSIGNWGNLYFGRNYRQKFITYIVHPC